MTTQLQVQENHEHGPDHTDCPAMIIIRYPISLHQRCKNSLIKWLSVHRNYTGKVAGVSNQIQSLEGGWPEDKGIALISFDSVKDAVMWVDCTPEIKQPDWLNGVDMAILPCREAPPADKRIIQLLDINFTDFDQFVNDYMAEAAPFLRESGAMGGVVSTDNSRKVKGLWEPGYIVLNFWHCAEQFEKSYYSDKYKPMKQKRMCYSNTSSCLLDLEPLIEPR